VTVRNVGTSAQRSVVTDEEGRFAVPGLLAATYQLRVDLAGFQSAVIDELVLRSGETARPTLTLNLAALNESVSVRAESPLLQTQSASVSAVITEKMLECSNNCRWRAARC
jgi:hypothetical protein